MSKNLLCFTARYLPGFQGGGPAKSVYNIVQNLRDEINFYIVTNDRDAYENKPFENINQNKWNSRFNSKVFYWKLNIFSTLKIINIILFEDLSTFYFNSFFSFRFTIFPLLIILAFKKNCRIILSPRGEFAPSALKLKSIKKKLYLRAFLFFRLFEKIKFHATSKEEYLHIKKNLPLTNSRITYARNLHSNYKNISRSHLRKSKKELQIIFISRITPMKNILFSLEVLSNLSHEINVTFHIYGVIADKTYWEKCKKYLNQMPSNINCKYCGSINPSDVLKTFREYDLFFLPSLGENFGHVIPEALSQGTAVLTSNNVPWKIMEDNNCGWCLPLNDTNNFIEIIVKLSKYTKIQFEELRRKCIDFSVKNFINDNEIEAYKRLLLDSK